MDPARRLYLYLSELNYIMHLPESIIDLLRF